MDNDSLSTLSNGTEDDNQISPPWDSLRTFATVTTFTGFCINIAFLIWVYQTSIVSAKIPRMLVTNVCVCDSVTCLLYALMKVIDVTVPSNALGDAICRLWFTWYVFWACFQTSVNSILLLTVERYLSVVHPTTYRRHVTPDKFKVLVALCWLFGAILVSYSLFRAERQGNYCEWTTLPPIVSKVRPVTIFMTFLAIPLAVTSYCNIRIIFVIRKQAKSSNKAAKGGEQQRMFIWFTFSASVAFTILIGPDTISFLLFGTSLVPNDNPDQIYDVTEPILCSHFAVTPILYFITMNKACRNCCFRKGTQQHQYPNAPNATTTTTSKDHPTHVKSEIYTIT